MNAKNSKFRFAARCYEPDVGSMENSVGVAVMPVTVPLQPIVKRTTSSFVFIVTPRWPVRSESVATARVTGAESSVRRAPCDAVRCAC